MPGIDDDNWREFAACRGADPELFFSLKKPQTDEARAYCAKCPPICRHLCIKEGNELRDPGIRGGMSTSQRQARYGVRLVYQPPPEPTIEHFIHEDDIPEAVLVRTGRFLRPEQITWIRKLHNDNWPALRIATLFGVAHNAVNRHLGAA